MLKMVIADDEVVIIRGLLKLVSWERLGITVIGECQDGKSALDVIVREKPELALLDINMPGMSGIELLQEIRALELPTQVIFISGFQDFEYVKAALRYGAVEYLLKPVIKDELVAAVEKCVMGIRGESVVAAETAELQKEVPYDRLVEMEETTYLPVLVEVLYESRDGKDERKLVRFAAISFLENELEKRRLGIVFVKNGHIVAVLKGVESERAKDILWEVLQAAEQEIKHRLAAVIGTVQETMGQIPGGYGDCLGMTGYFFFADQFKIPIWRVQEKVYIKDYSQEDLAKARQQMLEAMIAQDKNAWLYWFDQSVRMTQVLSAGKKEDACFYFCMMIRVIQDKLQAMGIKAPVYDPSALLEEGRACSYYGQMVELFRGYVELYWKQIQEAVTSNDKKDIILAKQYIETHYRENLTLEVLAAQVHMNPYYFSSFFKKQAGENFKDYVNKVRMEHALSLLLSSDRKTYEIADEVGFRESRAFSELFVKMYGETPMNYRKRIKNNEQV